MTPGDWGKRDTWVNRGMNLNRIIGDAEREVDSVTIARLASDGRCCVALAGPA